MPPLMSVGGAAADALLQMLTERERTKQQALINAHTMLQDQLAQQREAREEQSAQQEQVYRLQAFKQQQDEKAAALREKVTNDFQTRAQRDYVPGDIVTDAADAEGFKQMAPHLVQETPTSAVGPVQPGQTPISSAIRFMGTAPQRAVADKAARASQLLGELADPEKRALLMKDPVALELRAREVGVSLPASVVQPKPADERVYTIDPRTGKLTQAGTVPTGSHITTVPTGGVANAAMEKENMSSGELDMLARAYALEGPSAFSGLGIGNATAGIKDAAMKRAAQFNPDTGTFDAVKPPDLPALRQKYASTQAALTGVQKTLSAAQAFSDTAELNSKVLQTVLDHIPDTGSTWLNAPMRGAARMMGSTAMSQFDAIRTSLQNEYSRLIASPGLGGVVTDTMRKEMETILDPNATVGQLRASLRTLTTEAGNRTKAYQDQVDHLQRQFKPKDEQAVPAKPSAADLIKKYGGG